MRAWLPAGVSGFGASARCLLPRRKAWLGFISGFWYLFTCMLDVDYAKASGLGVGCHIGRCILLEAEPPAQSRLLSAELSLE